MTKKDPAAVKLGRKGGKARAAALTPERRKEIAQKAVQERWRRKREMEQREKEKVHLDEKQ